MPKKATTATVTVPMKSVKKSEVGAAPSSVKLEAVPKPVAKQAAAKKPAAKKPATRKMVTKPKSSANGAHAAAGAATTTHEDVARLAYELWQRRGCPEGTDLENWLRAEQSLVQ